MIIYETPDISLGASILGHNLMTIILRDHKQFHLGSFSVISLKKIFLKKYLTWLF